MTQINDKALMGVTGGTAGGERNNAGGKGTANGGNANPVTTLFNCKKCGQNFGFELGSHIATCTFCGYENVIDG